MDINTYLHPDTLATLQTGGYALMLGLMIVEGPLVTLAAAFLASVGMFDIRIVFILGWMGDIIGDLLFYSIGRYGLRIFQKKTTIDTQEEKTLIGKLDHIIHRNLALAILIIKFTPYAPPIGLTYIGKLGISLKKYLQYSLLLCIPIPLISTLVGFHLGQINMVIQQYSGITLLIYLSWAILIIALAGGVIFFLKKKSEIILKKEFATSVDEIEKNTKSDI